MQIAPICTHMHPYGIIWSHLKKQNVSSELGSQIDSKIKLGVIIKRVYGRCVKKIALVKTSILSDIHCFV